MRTSIWTMVSVLALGAACSPKPAAAPPPPPPAAEAPPPLPAASAPAPESPQAAPMTPETTAQPAAPAGPGPTEGVVHFAPGDYPAKERRIAALIANAETRDTSGETAQVAAQGRAERQRCATKACIEQSYAAEEARLRKWEGSGEVR
jgi:hypothetical protein